jgi:hypothetical protein
VRDDRSLSAHVPTMIEGPILATWALSQCTEDPPANMRSGRRSYGQPQKREPRVPSVRGRLPRYSHGQSLGSELAGHSPEATGVTHAILTGRCPGNWLDVNAKCVHARLLSATLPTKTPESLGRTLLAATAKFFPGRLERELPCHPRPSDTATVGSGLKLRRGWLGPTRAPPRRTSTFVAPGAGAQSRLSRGTSRPGRPLPSLWQ